MTRNEFGFTDSTEQFQAAIAYREAAKADGWSCRPTYESETVERAARLERDGFVMTIISRCKVGKWQYEASVNIWGPDGLSINPPESYDWGKITAGLETCNSCGKTDVETQRYAFAGRCCAECRPAMAKKHEFPGWTN